MWAGSHVRHPVPDKMLMLMTISSMTLCQSFSPHASLVSDFVQWLVFQVFACHPLLSTIALKLINHWKTLYLGQHFRRRFGWSRVAHSKKSIKFGTFLLSHQCGLRKIYFYCVTLVQMKSASQLNTESSSQIFNVCDSIKVAAQA